MQLAQFNRLFLEYETAKEKLRKNPQDSLMREAVLLAGRQYYANLRNGQLSIYDKQALANDLSTIIGTKPN